MVIVMEKFLRFHSIIAYENNNISKLAKNNSMLQFIAKSTSQKAYSSKRSKRQMLATGFASPADNFIENRLNIHELLIANATATYFFTIGSTDYAPDFCLHDIIIIDRSQLPQSGSYVVVVVNQQFSIAQVKGRQNNRKLLFYNSEQLVAEQEVCVWGVVSHLIRPL